MVDLASAPGLDNLQSSIMTQTDLIGKFLEENEPEYGDDRCFAVLKGFFEVFNEQLRINFELRDKLAKDSQKHARHYRCFEKLQQKIRVFLETLSGLAGRKVSDLNDAHSVLSEAMNRSTALASVRRQIEELEIENMQLDKNLESKKSEFEKLRSKASAETSEVIEKSQQTQARVEELRKQIRELEPGVQAKKENESKRNALAKQVRERKEAIERTRRKFQHEQKKRKAMRRALKQAITELRAKRQQLIADGEPLVKALEEAQSELETVKKMTKKELDSLAQQRADIEMDIQQLQARINERAQEKAALLAEFQSLQEQVTEAKDSADDLTRDAAARRKTLATIDEQTKEFLTDAPTAEQQLSAYDAAATEIAQAVADAKSQIENVKKENNKLRSKIRVNLEKIASVRKMNRKMECSVRVQTEELDDIKESLEKERKRQALYKSTLSEFESLRQELGLRSSATPMQVAECAVARAKEYEEKQRQEQKARRCSRRSVASDLDMLCEQLGKLQSTR